MRLLIEKFIENGKLVWFLTNQRNQQDQARTSSLGKIETETANAKRQGVGKGLVKGTGSLIPNKMTRIGKRGVEAKHGMEVKTIFLRSTLQLVDLPKEESLAQVEKPMLGR